MFQVQIVAVHKSWWINEKFLLSILLKVDKYSRLLVIEAENSVHNY